MQPQNRGPPLNIGIYKIWFNSNITYITERRGRGASQLRSQHLLKSHCLFSKFFAILFLGCDIDFATKLISCCRKLFIFEWKSPFLWVIVDLPSDLFINMTIVYWEKLGKHLNARWQIFVDRKGRVLPLEYKRR